MFTCFKVKVAISSDLDFCKDSDELIQFYLLNFILEASIGLHRRKHEPSAQKNAIKDFFYAF